MRYSKHPLCRFLQEGTGKRIRELAELAGMDERQLHRACKEGRTGKTIYDLAETRIVPCEVLLQYIDEAHKMRAEREKERIKEIYKKAGIPCENEKKVEAGDGEKF